MVCTNVRAGSWSASTSPAAAARRRELRAEFADAPVSLDLTWAPAGTLHRRFLGWLR
ncbi:hypothetical protein V6U89_22190 [Micromonospora sp. CPCC 206171]|uniref:hypothetical protein n=1 Tax=Micromonospora sp. CPCC 206171 TaxID=3122405 RepID=UPI002FEEA9B2